MVVMHQTGELEPPAVYVDSPQLLILERFEVNDEQFCSFSCEDTLPVEGFITGV